jgi:hypothetical protein
MQATFKVLYVRKYERRDVVGLVLCTPEYSTRELDEMSDAEYDERYEADSPDFGLPTARHGRNEVTEVEFDEHAGFEPGQTLVMRLSVSESVEA